MKRQDGFEEMSNYTANWKIKECQEPTRTTCRGCEFSFYPELSDGGCKKAMSDISGSVFSGYREVFANSLEELPVFSIYDIEPLDPERHPNFIGYEFKARTVDDNEFFLIMAYDKREHEMIFAVKDLDLVCP